VLGEGKPSAKAKPVTDCEMKQIGVNIMSVIGHNVLENYGLTRQFFRSRIAAWTRSR